MNLRQSTRAEQKSKIFSHEQVLASALNKVQAFLHLNNKPNQEENKNNEEVEKSIPLVRNSKRMPSFAPIPKDFDYRFSLLTKKSAWKNVDRVNRELFFGLNKELMQGIVTSMSGIIEQFYYKED